MEANRRIVYLCDGKRECRLSASCALNPDSQVFMKLCRHTADPDHAENGPCDCPEEFPGRFEKIGDENGALYWERESGEV